MELAVFYLVPYLLGAHALQVDIFGLFFDRDCQQLGTNLFDLHLWPFAGIAGQRVVF